MHRIHFNQVFPLPINVDIHINDLVDWRRFYIPGEGNTVDLPLARFRPESLPVGVMVKEPFVEVAVRDVLVTNPDRTVEGHPDVQLVSDFNDLLKKNSLPSRTE